VRPADTSLETFADGGEVRATPRAGVGQWILLALVQLYRIFLSPFLGGACKFYPSCSQYAQEAIAVHGAKRGSWLAMKRLGRCRPFTKGGFDPVPDLDELGENGEDKMASGAKAPGAAFTAGLKPRPSEPAGTGFVAAARKRPDYSDAEWLRTGNKELAQ
jgi:putative membrane protein insertion efficiency factor